jgi:hypothetical protein
LPAAFFGLKIEKSSGQQGCGGEGGEEASFHDWGRFQRTRAAISIENTQLFKMS